MDGYSEADAHGNSRIWREIKSGRKRRGVHRISITPPGMIPSYDTLITKKRSTTATLPLFTSSRSVASSLKLGAAEGWAAMASAEREPITGDNPGRPVPEETLTHSHLT